MVVRWRAGFAALCGLDWCCGDVVAVCCLVLGVAAPPLREPRFILYNGLVTL